MALFLAQHGLSLPKDKDPEKGLSEKGLENTKRNGLLILIFHSCPFTSKSSFAAFHGASLNKSSIPGIAMNAQIK